MKIQGVAPQPTNRESQQTQAPTPQPATPQIADSDIVDSGRAQLHRDSGELVGTQILEGAPNDGILTSAGGVGHARLAAARRAADVIATNIADPSPEAPQALREAVTELVKLADSEKDPARKLAIVSALYAHLEQLPAELGELTAPLRAEFIPVWAFESHLGGPGGFQPIHVSAFTRNADGKIDGLDGPRVSIRMPERIVTALDDMTFKPSEYVDSKLPRDVAPRADGSFVFDPKSPLTGATTAFFAANQVIDNADRWAGHEVAWGKDGKLEVVPYGFVAHFFNAYYDGKKKILNLGALGKVGDDGELIGFSGLPAGWKHEVEDLFLDSARSRDLVAHEAGHALLNAFKPGMYTGMGMAFSEGFADAITFLTALADPDVISRVLAETDGDLRKPNEATRMSEVIGQVTKKFYNDDPKDDGEEFMRSALTPLTVKDVDPKPTDNKVLGMGMVPSRDPHLIGQVFCGAVYDLFVASYEEEVAAGKSREEAIATARDRVGTLMLRSTRFIGEHSVSFEQWALAMVRAEGDLYGGRHAATLRKVLTDRHMFSDGLDVDAVIAKARESMPDLVLLPTVTQPADILALLEVFEAAQVKRALAASDEERPSMTLLRHNRYVPTLEKIPAGGLKIYSDTTSEDGVRVLRLYHEEETADLYGGPPTKGNVYKSLVFDPAGKLIAAHLDEPIVSEF